MPFLAVDGDCDGESSVPTMHHAITHSIRHAR